MNRLVIALTGAVVAIAATFAAVLSMLVRLAAYLRRDAWDRITAQQQHLMRKERRLAAASEQCTCGALVRYWPTSTSTEG